LSTQDLDVKKAWRAIRRRPRLVAAVAGAGLLAGVVVGVLNPPMYSAKSLVVLPPPSVNTATGNAEASQSIDTQVFIADSEPVLKSAGQNVSPPLSTKAVRDRVDVQAVTADVIEIKARGTTAQQSITLANAVAEVYLVFVTTEQKLPGDLGKKSGARVLEQATTARGGNWIPHLGMYGLLGALAGALAGAIWILAAARGDRRLRMRDEIADAVGIPVLASVASYRAKDVSDWANLLERYTPGAVDAWSLRKTLRRLGLDVKGGPPVSLAVITFADDDRALPLGPQLAAFATSIGIVTDLVVDTHHESTNPLLEGDPAVPGAAEGTERRLLGGTQSGELFAKVALRIHLIVVDRDAPQLAGTLHTTTTVVGISSGAVTAEELARLAVAAAADDRTIDGLVVADPDPADRTTGRVPQAMRRSSSRLPTLLTGAARRTTK
jgi:capsular polysaccharide biosynthesis protein